MKTCLCGGIWLLLLSPWAGGHDRARAAGDGPDEVEKKLQDVEKGLEHLRQREQDLLRVRDRTEYIYKWEGGKLVLGFALGEVVGGGSAEEVRRATLRPRDFAATPETAAPVVMTFRRVEP
jgi:hypothetical protein